MYIHNIKKVNYRRESEQEGDYISNKGDLSQTREERETQVMDTAELNKKEQKNRKERNEGAGEREKMKRLLVVFCVPVMIIADLDNLFCHPSFGFLIYYEY